MEEIQAKKILIKNKAPSRWFGVFYQMNVYRGCPHQCIYCDSRSECYRIDSFDSLQVKTNALDLLEKELKNKKRHTVGTGAMSDPYVPQEKELNITGQALELLARKGFPVVLITKSNLVLRDIDTLLKINEKQATVAFTITTADDALAKIIEPNSPSPTERFKAMGILSELGIYTGVTLMPVLPFITDGEQQIKELLEKALSYGAKFVIPGFGVTLRDRQRDYFYQKLDGHFPGLKEKYIKSYGNRYHCGSRNSKKLYQMTAGVLDRYGIPYTMAELSTYEKKITQISLFDQFS